MLVAVLALCVGALSSVGAELPASSVSASKWVVLHTGTDGKTWAEGDAALADQPYTPASTFKVLIAWAALEEGKATPSTLHRVSDKHVPGAPRELSMTEAMFYSSNDYFIWLAGQVGRDRLDAYLLRSGWVRGAFPKDWLGKEWDRVERGGNLTITPRQNHDFMCGIAKGRFASSSRVQTDLLTAMRWPSDREDLRLYGKTGTAGGAVWFNGFGDTAKGRQVVTVFMPGGLELRPQVIEKFYECFGSHFKTEWLASPVWVPEIHKK